MTSNNAVSQQVEDLLVARNLRGMQTLQRALESGYYGRASKLLLGAVKSCSTVFIATGFPVRNMFETETFETDGPVGAVALYEVLEEQGANPLLLCPAPLAQCLNGMGYRSFELSKGSTGEAELQALQLLDEKQPGLIISIECPGMAADNLYYNMRGKNISAQCACVDAYLRGATCPTIAIGDGGNEAGMGKVVEALSALDITPCVTPCDELLVADVSNWAAYGLIALLGVELQQDFLQAFDYPAVLEALVAGGAVDGISGQASLSEDNQPLSAGQALIARLRQITGFA